MSETSNGRDGRDRRAVRSGGHGGGERSACLVLVVLLVGLSGCNVDSYLDPSVVGRWERTPTKVPILERIASIEPDDGQAIQVSEVTAEDLVPTIADYRIGPGDTMQIVVFDLPSAGMQTPYQLTVDGRGEVIIPQVGHVHVGGLTEDGVREAIARGIAQAGLLQMDPLVMVSVTGRRQQRYSVNGAVRAPGPYFIPEPNFRLLEALTSAGWLNESIPEVLVIRQVALSDEAIGQPSSQAPGTEPAAAQNPTPPPPSGQDLIDLIEELGTPEGEKDDGSNPDVLPSTASSAVVRRVQPGSRSVKARQPAIDLVEPEAPAGAPPEAEQKSRPDGGGPTSWVFVNGRWTPVQERSAAAGGAGDLAEGPGLGPSAEQLFTQRVISVPTSDLIAGNAKYNIVIRPGDIIRVPNPPQGLVYIAGEVNRPGVYNLSQQLTLTRAIDAAGGLNGIGIPERLDLTRMVDKHHQATIRLDLRAINEGTQPDLYLKSNDRINVGTNFWAFPLAVVRGGFRATYGFGFLLDRNFGNDVFGAPPSNVGSGGRR